MHFIILYIKFVFLSEHSISHRLPCSHAVWSLVLDGNLLNLVKLVKPTNNLKLDVALYYIKYIIIIIIFHVFS